MICYRDMTFCNHWRDCDKAEDCSRPLTAEVQQAADKWWLSFGTTGEGAPICTFVNKPGCHSDNEESE